MNEEIRYKAAAAVVALANRADSAGKKDASAAKGKQWQPMPFSPNTAMHVEKLREGVAYYEIAESIQRDAAGFGYPRAMLLESMGAYDEAIAVFRALAGTIYEQPGTMGVQRCLDKQRGSYDELTSLGLSQEFLDALGDIDADALFADGGGLSGAGIDAGRTRAAAKNDERRKPTGDDDQDAIRQQAADTALAFVNHLLDRNYIAARALLHPDESGFTEDELREAFEPMFEGEEFPQSANVFDVQTDMPNLELDEIAWVYVTIDSENAEAVSLHVARAGKRLTVRSIEWGRP